MPDLEMLLRDVRPAPDPAWAARLDARVANGFPRPPAAWKRPVIVVREHLLAFGTLGSVTAVLIVLVLAGIRSGGSDDAAISTTVGASSGGSAKQAAPEGFSVTPSPPARRDPAVKSTTSLTLSTTPDDVQSVSDRAIRVVDSLGGYVQSSEIDTAGSRASATLALKIPAAKVDDGLARLSKLAHVSARTQQTEDLTDQRAYLEARVRDARADREGLRARLAKAATDKERSRLRALLDRATRRVTQRQRAVAALGQEVAYADVDLTISGRKQSGAAAAKPGDRWTPGDALADAGRVLEVIAGIVVIALAVLLPVAAIGVLAAFVGRFATRRRRLRALEMA